MMEPHQDSALVLVVDDDRILRYWAREVLEEVGATDFVTKPMNWKILTQRLRYTL